MAHHGIAKSSRPLKKFDGKKYLLLFGAIDGNAVIYVNNVKVSEHLLGPNGQGYDDDFMVDITQSIQTGDNLIAIQVTKKVALAGITKGITLLQM